MDEFVEMTGTGTASAPPDVVVLDLSVRAPGSSVAAALGSADQGMAAVIGLAKERGVRPSDLQTTSASVYPQYDREGVNVNGYVAQQSLRLRVRERDQVGLLISAFSDAIGNTLTIDNISLQIADPAPLFTEARRGAFADAEGKARQFASLAGRSLGQVVWLVDAVSSGAGPMPMAVMAADTAKRMYAGSTPVEMGENSVSVIITVRWAWT
ncbi:SIMPL domain-containing protein [Nostocoides vanveenii]